MTWFKAGTTITNGSEFGHSCPYFLRGGAFKAPACSLTTASSNSISYKSPWKIYQCGFFYHLQLLLLSEANTAHHHFQTKVSITLETKYGTTRAVISILKWWVHPEHQKCGPIINWPVISNLLIKTQKSKQQNHDDIVYKVRWLNKTKGASSCQVCLQMPKVVLIYIRIIASKSREKLMVAILEVAPLSCWIIPT